MNYAPATGDVLLVDYEVSNGAFVQGSNSIIVQETPIGLVNSSNKIFTTLLAKYVANSLEVFVNGLQQTLTTDYAETTPGSGVFTFVTAPVTGDTVRISYQFSTGASANADTVDGVHASTTATPNNLYPLSANSYFPPAVLIGSPTVPGMWGEELIRYTASSTGTISITGIPARKYLQVEGIFYDSTSTGHRVQFNGDTAANYASNWSNGGGTTVAATADTSGIFNDTHQSGSNSPGLLYMRIINIASAEKVAFTHYIRKTTNGAASAPALGESVIAWVNTSAQINRMDFTGSYLSGTQIIIRGHD
jgi:hypothetical protein